MVVKGRGKFPMKKKPVIPPPTPNIEKIASLTRQPASDKALELLHEVATLVTPIMHHYNFKVGLLCEMYPKNQGLLGLNVNGGQKICLRLRSPTDSKWFLDRDEIVGTMLHELTHNWHGPHDAKFYKVLDELKDKYLEFQIKESLKTTSYANNFNTGRILKKPKTTTAKKYTTRITKLGTEMTTVKLKGNLTMRELMLRAAERRLKDSKTCSESADKYKDVPDDSELFIIDVISLDSDDENDTKPKDVFKIKLEPPSSEKKNINSENKLRKQTNQTVTDEHEVIFLD